MRSKLLFWVLFIGLLQAQINDVNIIPRGWGHTSAKVRILDQKVLSFSKINDLKFSEISDLAYDDKAQKLYMISDEGRLFGFEARFGERVEYLQPLSAVKIRKKDGGKYKKWQRDTEGMCLGSKGGLLISFEGNAKLGLYGEDGREIKAYSLPAILQNPKHYRSQNKSLEALSRHPRYGALMVAEWPLKKDHKKHQTIYSLSGKKWHFQAEPEAKSATTAIEVMDDGNLLVLERSFIDFMEPMVITLKKVYLEECRQNTLCRSEVLLKMNSRKGWDVDNFEGLTRVGKDRYLMVSDDNQNFFQRTLLIYFEVPGS